MSEGPGAGHILIGIFLILFGLCMTLLGGGCTAILLSYMSTSHDDSVGLFLLLFLALLAGGIGMLWLGARFLLGKYRT